MSHGLFKTTEMYMKRVKSNNHSDILIVFVGTINVMNFVGLYCHVNDKLKSVPYSSHKRKGKSSIVFGNSALEFLSREWKGT